MTSILIIVGLVVLTVTGIDVLWTVVAAGSGAGPLTARLSAVAWRVALWFGRRPEGPRHALLAVFGVAIVAADLLDVEVPKGARGEMSAEQRQVIEDRLAAAGMDVRAAG